MLKCYFGSNLEKDYSCKYEIFEDKIEVIVEYNIEDEIKSEENGIKIWTGEMSFENRDMVILNNFEGKILWLKSASWSQFISNRSATVTNFTKFRSREYLIFDYCKNWREIVLNGKVDCIRIISKQINELYFKSYSGVSKTLNLKKESININVPNSKWHLENTIDCNNIDKLIIDGEVNYFYSTLLSLSISGHLEIELKKACNCSDVFDYIREFMIYAQLFCPNKIKIDKVGVKIEEKYYRFITKKIKPITYRCGRILESNASVDDKLIEFLAKCYTRIAYRCKDTAVRNILQVVMYRTSNIEDSFLTVFRFIECFCKSNPEFMNKARAEFNKIREDTVNKIERIQSKLEGIINEEFEKPKVKSIIDKIKGYNDVQLNEIIIKNAIDNHYTGEVKSKPKEICQLRNHYVHSGYYIHNLELEIKDSNNKYHLKVDYNWLKNTTNMLF